MNPQTFFDHFERLMNAPNAVPRLRELILQLAVECKFTHQNINNKQLKCGRVSDYIKILNGYAFKSEWFVKDGIRLVRNANVGHGTIHWSDTAAITIEQAEGFSRFALAEGDIVISLDRPLITTGLKVARISSEDLPSLLLQRVGKVEFITNEVDPDFFFMWLSSPLFISAIDPGRSNGVPHISSKSIEALPLSVPPIKEQKHIVAKVEELMRLCDELEREQTERRTTRSHFSRVALDRLLAAHNETEFHARWQSVSDHFTTLTVTPDLLSELRQTILQLAVQGKLTHQDSQDEPATSLIRHIRIEKERLVKAKRLKPADLLPPVNSDETPFDLPSGWMWARFGNITINRDGERVPIEKSIREHRQGKYDYYGASGVIDKFNDYIFDKSLLLIGEDGANLINRSTPIAFIAHGKYWVNNHAHVLDSISLDCLKYLEIYINATDLRPYITGTAQPKMNQAKMNLIGVAVPPAEEQKRIVAAINRLMTFCDELEANLRRAEKDGEQLLRASVRSMLTSTTENSAVEVATIVVQ
jgi:type I restriction enzyme S subunit